MHRSNPKSKKSCASARKIWVSAHKSRSSKGKVVKVKGACRKKHNSHRAMLGSRFSSPYCPGTSIYKDDTPDGGKMCEFATSKKQFKINSNGDCDDDAGCAIAVSGPICPGISIGDVDLKGGNRRCNIPGSKEGPFEIDKKGNCVDPAHCAVSATSVIKKAAASVADAASKAIDAASKIKLSGMRKRMQSRSNPKSIKSCASAHMKWVASHKSKSSKGKTVKVRGSCRKKHNSRK